MTGLLNITVGLFHIILPIIVGIIWVCWQILLRLICLCR